MLEPSGLHHARRLVLPIYGRAVSCFEWRWEIDICVSALRFILHQRLLFLFGWSYRAYIFTYLQAASNMDRNVRDTVQINVVPDLNVICSVAVLRVKDKAGDVIWTLCVAVDDVESTNANKRQGWSVVTFEDSSINMQLFDISVSFAWSWLDNVREGSILLQMYFCINLINRKFETLSSRD